MDQDTVTIQVELGDSYDLRECPECGMMTLKGMPGGRDATCVNCGYKDPCCYDY
jgi:predicted RNA-binding Zn-ribbon protein involved in translation (DUF1610 family)